MKVDDLIKAATALGAVQGVEKELRTRRRRGTLAGVGAVALQIAVLAGNKDYLPKLGHFLLNLFSGHWRALFAGPNALDGYELLALGSLVSGGMIWTVLRNTQLLLAESSEPFRYTFSVAPFERLDVSGESQKEAPADPQLKRLHLDVIDRLSRKHQRLALLDPKALPEAEQERLFSHIHVSGTYIVRGGSEGASATTEVFARVRIGPPTEPEQVVNRVETGAEYQDVIQQLQAQIEQAMYTQIRSDISKKIRLFPTSFRRAAGLFYEAQDFEQSNTIDAFDHSLSLYRESLRYFDLSWTSWFNRLWPGPRAQSPRLLEARARVAFSRCLVFRRLMSATAGRRQNPIYELREQLDRRALPQLEKLYDRVSLPTPKRSRGSTAFNLSARFLTQPARQRAAMRRRLLSDGCRQALFEAYVVSSLSYGCLKARARSEEQLGLALATAPDTADQSALYLLAKSSLQSDIVEKQRLLEKAKEYAPKSETIHYSYALALRTRFLRRNDLARARAQTIADAFDRVQELNPGNVASYAACGHIWWLIGDLDRAESEFNQGIRVKAVQQDAFIGELNYGLARIAAERGNIDSAYDLYQRAIDANPDVASCAQMDKGLTSDSYAFMTSSTLARYRQFLALVQAHTEKNAALRAATSPTGEATDIPSRRTCDTVLSLALNDCANACFNYYLRTGVPNALTQAIELLETAQATSPSIAAVKLNLSYAYSWASNTTGQIRALQEAANLAPSWTPWLMDLLERYLDKLYEKKYLEGCIASLRKQHGDCQTELDSANKEFTDVERELESLKDEKRVAPLLASRNLPLAGESTPTSTPVDAAAERQQERDRLDRAKQRLEGKSWDLERRRQVLTEKKQTLEGQLSERLNDIKNEEQKLQELNSTVATLKPVLGRIIKSSRFAAFFLKLDLEADDWEPLLPELGRMAADAYGAINIAHVGDDFVDLVRLLARVCSWQSNGRDVARELYSYVLNNFNDKDFTAHSRLVELYGPPTTMESPAQIRARYKSLSVVESAVAAAIAEDTTHWMLLNHWALLHWEQEVAKLDAAQSAPLLDELRGVAEKGTLTESAVANLGQRGIDLSSSTAVIRKSDSCWVLADRSSGKSFRLTHEDENAIVIRSYTHSLVDALKRATPAHDEKRPACPDSQLDGRTPAEVAVSHLELARRYHHAILARGYPELGDYKFAVEQYELAAKAASTDAQYWLELAQCHIDAGEPERACAAYRNAIPYAPVEALKGLTLAEVSMAKPGRRLEQLTASVNALRELELPADEFSECASRLVKLEAEQRNVQLFGEPWNEDGGFTRPILMEIGAELIPVVDPAQDQGHFINAGVESVREAVEREFGLRLPRIGFRPSGTLPKTEYVFLIDEVPEVRGVIPRPAEGDGLAGALLAHLEVLLRSHLACWCDLQGVSELVTEWRNDADCAPLLDEVLKGPDDLLAFARVLRALLSEQIPILDRGTILRTVRTFGLGRNTTVALFHRLRERLKDQIPGNKREATLLELPAELAVQLAPGPSASALVPVLEPPALHDATQRAKLASEAQT